MPYTVRVEGEALPPPLTKQERGAAPQTDGPAVGRTHVPQPISGGFGDPAVS